MNVEIPSALKRSDFERKSTSSETGNSQLDNINNLVHSFNKLTQSIDLMDAKEHSCKNLIKEVPNLDKWARYKVLKLFNTTAKKVEFTEMSLEEPHEWITYEFGK